MDTERFCDDASVSLDAPAPVEVKQEQKEKPSRIWSSCSESSSSLIGVVPVESVNPSFTDVSSPKLSEEHQLIAVQHGVEEYVSTALETLEQRLEMVLDSISDELTSEVIRERQHLLLMQEKVDMQGQALQREFTELNKKMTQESTIRSMVQQKYREQNDALGQNLESISREIIELKSIIHNLQTPWMYRAFSNLVSVFQQCSGGSCEYEPLKETEDS